MIVTHIEPLTKGKSKIYIDEMLAFALFKGEMSRYNIETGSELSKKDYDEIRETIILKRAKSRALYLLGSMERTEDQLRSKLRQNFYPEDIILQVVDYVKSYHYVDDERYVKYFIDYKSASKSKAQIMNLLMQKGVSKELIEDELNKLDENSEIQLIEKFVNKKRIDLQCISRVEKQKLYAQLLRKGFKSQDISRILKNSYD